MRRSLAILLAVLAAAIAAPSAVAKKPDPTWEDVFANPTVTQQVDVGTSIAAEGCWSITTTQQKSGWWGYWRHWQSTYWCGNGSVITYRSSSDHAAAGGTCTVSYGPNTWKTYGGVNYPVVRVRTQTTFGCIGGWFNGSPFFEVAYDPNGLSWIYGWSEG